MTHVNSHRKSGLRKAFSLIELVIVIVIIGIIAAIAIPKMSKGSAGAGDSALQGNLAVLRNAVELYYSEHGAFPSGTADNVTDQLTKFTNGTGGVSATKTSAYPYGPYLRKIPPMPVGSKKGKALIKVTSGATPATPSNLAADEVWLYNSDSGDVQANLPDTDKDSSDTKYNTY